MLFLNCILIYPQGNNTSVEKIYKKLSAKELKYIPFSDSITLIEGKQKKTTGGRFFTIGYFKIDTIKI